MFFTSRHLKRFLSAAQRLERLRKERQNQIRCKNVQWKDRSGSQSGKLSHLVVEKTRPGWMGLELFWTVDTKAVTF